MSSTGQSQPSASASGANAGSSQPAGQSSAQTPVQQASAPRQTVGGAPPPAATGLVRPRRRVIQNKTKPVYRDDDVVRNYAVTSEVVYTNYTELKNDCISAEFAQDIIEEFMTVSGIDMANRNATTMVEDIIFTFYVQNAASIKTSYEKVIDVYGVELDMMLLLQILVSHEVLPRRFTRGLAGRIFQFLRKPENESLRVDLASKHNLEDKDDAVICFDGSTHIPKLSSAQRSKANMMASRGIYENVASAQNADTRATYEGALSKKTINSGALHLMAQN